MSTAMGLVRMADALLQAVGGQPVTLRMPAPAVANVAGEQVGVEQPQFQDYVLKPVTFRKVRAKVSWANANGGKAVGYEALVSAASVEQLVGTLAYESASVLFRDALGLILGETLLRVESFSRMEMLGAACMYRLLLREPLEWMV